MSMQPPRRQSKEVSGNMEEETGTGDDVSLQKEEGGRRQDDGVQKSSHWLWDVFQAFQAREELKSFLVIIYSLRSNVVSKSLL